MTPVLETFTTTTKMAAAGIRKVVAASPAVFNAVLAETLETKSAAASLFVLVTGEDDATGVSCELGFEARKCPFFTLRLGRPKAQGPCTAVVVTLHRVQRLPT